jgi:hypothetical protein
MLNLRRLPIQVRHRPSAPSEDRLISCQWKTGALPEEKHLVAAFVFEDDHRAIPRDLLECGRQAHFGFSVHRNRIKPYEHVGCGLGIVFFS